MMDEERYEESLAEFQIAQKYIEKSPGFQFFSVAQYCIDKARLYERMGRTDKVETILEKCRLFCEEKGYEYKLKLISMYREESDQNSVTWDLSLKGISLEQIESNVKSLAVQYSNKRQERNMEFLSIWQKTVDNYDDIPEKLIETYIKTFKKYFNIDHVLFIRFENGVPVVKYDDSDAITREEQIDYVVNYFEDNRADVITSRTEINYYEHRELIDTVLCSEKINAVIFAPIYKNEKLDSIFASYSLLRDSWNSLNSKMVCDKEELPIFKFFFRELLATIERLEDKIEISKMNNKLQEANGSLSQLAAKADAANRAKSDFLAKMSHEIRTPINAVIGMNEMILRESTEQEIHKYAFDIKSSANTLLSIINEILDASKIESGKLEIIPVDYDVSSLFHDVYNMINLRTQKKGLTLVFDIDKNMPSGLYGDDIRLRQIVVNLLTNAVKYTHAGTVTLTVKSEVKDKKTLLYFKVTDTGIGIKEEDIGKLFVQFERIEESRNRNIEGTGLGMNITQQLLRLMGSELNVKSVYGEGSEFSFCIEQGITNAEPLGEFNERINQRASEYNYTLSYVAPNAKILVVDDNDINRKVVRSLLKKTQIKVSEADSGMACIKILEEEKFDIVFLDFMMPVMDGVETLNIIRNRHLCDDNPVIMLTANAIVGAKEQFLSEGFDDYLTKPIAPEKLDKMILEYLPKELVIEGECQEEKTEENNLPAIDEFDFDYAIRILTDKDILLNTLQDFNKMLGVLPEKLNGFYMNIEDAEQLNLYKIEVHALKSSAAMVGAMLLSKLARLLEVASIEKNLDRIIVLHPILIEEISKHRARLLKVFPEVQEKLEINDMEMILGYFDMLEMAVLSDDYETADFVCEEIQKYNYPEPVSMQVVELVEKVNHLNADAALQLLSIIKGNW
jgi:signal transduction histidine kinase/CheY-like chemotaxis protein